MKKVAEYKELQGTRSKSTQNKDNILRNKPRHTEDRSESQSKPRSGELEKGNTFKNNQLLYLYQMNPMCLIIL